MGEKYISKYTGQQIDNLLDKVSLWLKGGDSENGATFYPHVTKDGTLSWENDKNLANPPEVIIMGPPGPAGPAGPAGPKGDPGPAGNDGKSAYAYAQEKGYGKTEDEFAEDLSKIGDAGAVTKQLTGVTVLATGWIDETETTALFRYRIEDARIPANHSAEVDFSVTDHTEDTASSMVRATNHGCTAATTCNAGYVDIYCSGYKGTEFVGAPDTDLLVDIKLTEVKEV